MSIDSDLIDVDFAERPQFVFGDLGRRAFEPRFAAYGDAVPVIPESQWPAEAEKIKAAGGGCSALVSRIYDQGQEGSCFPPGTLVTMASGEVRPIEDVKNLESVVTAEGNYGEVRQTMVRPFVGQLVGVHLHGHNLVRCTPEHPILTARGYVPAAELTSSDYVACTKTWAPVCKVLQTASHLPAKHRCSNELRTLNFGAPQGRTKTSITIPPVPDMLELDAKLGRIIGLMLAEGNIDKQKIVWTFNINEVDTLVLELRALLLERLGLESKLRIAGSRCTAKVEVYGTLWARLFESLIATGSGRKRLCAELASGPIEFLEAVFYGWMAGDGHRKERINTGVTISRMLAVQMFQIGCKLGLQPALRRSEPSPNAHAKTRQPRYDLTFTTLEKPAENFRRTEDGKHCWRRVRLLTREDYSGPVFNLHVHGDESYVADGLGVHNCVANACSQAHEIVQAAQWGKENVVHLSAISLYKRIGRSAQSGAMVSDGLDEMAERGVLPLDNPENRARFGDCVMPNTGFRTAYPAGWEAVAAKFAAHEWFIVDTVAELITALIHQHPVVVGRSGHSICYCDPVYDGGKLYAKYANSWGTGFGENGFGYDSLSMIRSSASWAFALRSVTTP